MHEHRLCVLGCGRDGLVYIEPGQLEVESRDYYIEPRADEQMKLDSFLNNIEQHYDIAVHETASVEIPGLSLPSMRCITTTLSAITRAIHT